MSGLEEHQPCGAQGVPLINIDTKEVYSRDLLPGAISRGMYVRDWLKRWVNRYWLYKSGEAAVKEQECSEFCHRLGVKCADVLTIGHGACVKNIAFLRDANTGAYLGRSPLYDFDHAYDTTRKADALTSEAAYVAHEMRDQAIQLLEAAIPVAPKPWVAARAQTILDKL